MTAKPDKLAREIDEALNERNLFINPDILDKIADEIDCCPGCESVSYDHTVNVSECSTSERGDYCPNDLAETLRALAKVSRKLDKQTIAQAMKAMTDALRSSRCPSPTKENEGGSVAFCVDSGTCGCDNAAALRSREGGT